MAAGVRVVAGLGEQGGAPRTVRGGRLGEHVRLPGPSDGARLAVRRRRRPAAGPGGRVYDGGCPATGDAPGESWRGWLRCLYWCADLGSTRGAINSLHAVSGEIAADASLYMLLLHTDLCIRSGM